MTADFSNLSPVSSDPAQFHGLIGVTLEGDPRLLDPSVLGGGGSGTVTSVGLSVPTGLTVTGSPITTSGTIALNFAPGYGIPTTVRQSEWDAAYNDKINTATFNTTNGILTLTQQDGGTITINLDGRYLTSFTESDPVFSASPAAGITAPQISNWDIAFGWGNHAVAGYLLSSTAATTYQPLDGDLTAIGALAGTTGLLRKTAANSWSLDFDPVYIGGVAYFNRPTKPTERSAGVPLVIGDHWYKTDDGTEWFWNGTYWLSPQKTAGWGHGSSFAIRYTASSTSDVTYSAGCLGENVFVYSLLIQVVVNSVNNGSNYWTVGAVFGNLRINNSNSGSNTPILFDTTSLLPTTPDVVTITVNTLAGASLVDIRRGQILKVGSPGELYLNYAIKYSEVA